MRNIGLHLRLTESLCDLARRAIEFNIPIFQCFFIHQETYQPYIPTAKQIEIFLSEYRPRFSDLYLHGSYWINLSQKIGTTKVFYKELELAKKLSFNYIVLHPGSPGKNRDKLLGIKTLAKNLNIILKTEDTIKIILENTAHGGSSIGGDFNDFLLLKEYLDYPEKIFFCIDTAHAHVYGYDLLTRHGQKEFWTTIENTIGFDFIKLIHLNDTNNPCNSFIDRHEKVGTGLLATALPQMIQYSPINNVPIILELPRIPAFQELTILQMVREWTNKN